MARLTEREKKVFVLCLITLLIYGAYAFLIVPLNSRQEKLRSEILAQESQLGQDLKIIAQSKWLDKKYENYVQHFRQIGTDEETVSSMLEEIEKGAGEFGLQVTELKPEKARHNDIDHQFSIGLMASSELISVIRFLYAMQQKPHYFYVEQVKFERASQRGDSSLTTNLILGKALTAL